MLSVKCVKIIKLSVFFIVLLIIYKKTKLDQSDSGQVVVEGVGGLQTELLGDTAVRKLHWQDVVVLFRKTVVLDDLLNLPQARESDCSTLRRNTSDVCIAVVTTCLTSQFNIIQIKWYLSIFLMKEKLYLHTQKSQVQNQKYI